METFRQNGTICEELERIRLEPGLLKPEPVFAESRTDWKVILTAILEQVVLMEFTGSDFSSSSSTLLSDRVDALQMNIAQIECKKKLPHCEEREQHAAR